MENIIIYNVKEITDNAFDIIIL